MSKRQLNFRRLCLKNNFTNFQALVWQKTASIPAGQVTTYKELAKAVGRPQAVRAVGNILGKNPYAPQLPCHRVVRSNGKIGGYAGGSVKKIKLLKKEGVLIKNGKIFNFSEIFYRF